MKVACIAFMQNVEQCYLEYLLMEFCKSHHKARELAKSVLCQCQINIFGQQVWWIDAVFLCFCTTGIWNEIICDFPKITLLLHCILFFINKVIAEMYFNDTCSKDINQEVELLCHWRCGAVSKAGMLFNFVVSFKIVCII